MTRQTTVKSTTLPPTHLLDDAGLLQEVVGHDGALDGVALVKAELDKLAETRGVVVHQRLGVAPGLQQRVELDDLLLQAVR